MPEDVEALHVQRQKTGHGSKNSKGADMPDTVHNSGTDICAKNKTGKIGCHYEAGQRIRESLGYGAHTESGTKQTQAHE